MTQIGELDDGTQIWKITHNGVDTHPIHLHLFNVQLINHVAWDGAMLAARCQRVGLERNHPGQPAGRHDRGHAAEVAAALPFDLPNSVRLIDPNMPEGVPCWKAPPVAFVDPTLNAVTVINHYGQLRLGIRLALPHLEP